ncbi:MAG: winged helix-turn-helix domain-containing protein [Actinomycetota bacterium]|nr:winged helix-turn-helix domain-containing protein [Actinomycetota bacterium]
MVGADNAEIHLGRKQQQLLALLMLNANGTVPADVLIDYLWGEDLPANPLNSLQDVVKRLRIALGDRRHEIIVTRDKNYGLAVDPDLLDLTLFRRLASAGLALQKSEPAIARLLLSRALEVAVGELPDIAPAGHESEEIDTLYALRRSALDALESISSEPTAPPARSQEEFPVSLQDRPVGLALKLAELGELRLADLVGHVTRFQGSIHQLSQGVLVATFPGVGTALRSAAEIAESFGGGREALLGGAVSHVAAGGWVQGAEPLLRLAGRADHGQILVSPSVHDSATTAGVAELLRKVDEDLWQVGKAAIATPAVSGAQTEMPLVGREKNVLEIDGLLKQRRLVTLRGPGGIGKTRIAREMAKVVAERFADGVSIVDLAEADQHADPVSVVVRSLGLIPEPYRRPVDTLVDRLRQSERLIILDNCEEFVEDVRLLAEALMEGCPQLTLLTTSRSALGAVQESVYDIGELDIADAAELLVALAFREEGPGGPDAFDSKVLGLCALLDSVPLAIECAAAMIRAIGLDEATAALTSLPDGAVLPLLDAAHGGRGRHRSIELALNASYHRLDIEDARFFERLSSLRGDFDTADSLAAVPDEGVYSAEAGLARLIEASLLKQLGPDRWRMLEPVRQFAATRLLRRGEQAAQAARHAKHFVRLAKDAEGQLRSPDEAVWFEKLARAYPNLVKALSWAVESGDASTALELTSSLWWYWAARGMFVEGSESVERALALEDEAPRVLRAKALVAASHLAWWAGNPHRTESSLAEAMLLITPRDPGDPELTSLEAWARTGLAGSKMWGGGDYQALEAHLEEGLRLFTSIGDAAGTGLNLSTHSGVAWHHGKDDLHHSKARKALAAFESAGHQTMIAHSKRVLGLATAGLGEIDAGRPLILEGLRQSEELGDVGGLPLGLCFLGLLEVWGGNREAAVDAFRRSIVVNRNFGLVWPSLLAIGFASEEACLTGRPADAIRLTAVVEGLTERTGIRLPPQDRPRVEAAVERAARTVGPHEAAKAHDEGFEMEVAEAILLALEIYDQSGAGV